MSRINGLQTFNFPGDKYLPDIIELPEKVTDFNYENMSKWLHNGLTEQEMRTQAGPILESPVVETLIDTENYYGKSLKVKCNDDFALKIYDSVGKKSDLNVVVAGEDWYSLDFMTSGSCAGKINGHNFQFKAGTCVMLHHEPDAHYVQHTKAYEHVADVDLAFRPHILTEKLGISKKALSDLLHPHNELTPAQGLSWCYMTPKIMSIINDIHLCSMDVTTFKMFAESKALELLSYYLLALQQQTESLKQQDKFPKIGIEQLYKAQALLKENYRNPPCIDALCKKVGLSRSKLTRGFKSQFGTTVYEYVQSYRMEKARQLLEDQQLNVDLVAEFVGYNDANSFRKIFHRHFGVLPGKFKSGLHNSVPDRLN